VRFCVYCYRNRHPPPVPQVKIAIETLSLRQPLRKALTTAARLGADGVLIDARTEVHCEDFPRTAVRQFRKLLEDLGLRVSAVSFPTRHGYDEPQDLERRLAATRAAMNFAYQIGSQLLVCRIGRIPDDQDSPSWNVLVESLTDLGTHGQKCGARLAARTLSNPPERLARLIAALPDASMGVSLDPRALIVGGHSPAEAVALLGPSILHVHANDAVHDLALGRAIEVTLGRGTADYPELLGALEEYDYRGWFTLERHSSDDPVGEIGDAVQYLRSL